LEEESETTLILINTPYSHPVSGGYLCSDLILAELTNDCKAEAGEKPNVERSTGGRIMVFPDTDRRIGMFGTKKSAFA
jgi:hypothetical protein